MTAGDGEFQVAGAEGSFADVSVPEWHIEKQNSRVTDCRCVP